MQKMPSLGLHKRKKLSVHVNLLWGTELELLFAFFGVLSDVILLVKWHYFKDHLCIF